MKPIPSVDPITALLKSRKLMKTMSCPATDSRRANVRTAAEAEGVTLGDADSDIVRVRLVLADSVGLDEWEDNNDGDTDGDDDVVTLTDEVDDGALLDDVDLLELAVALRETVADPELEELNDCATLCELEELGAGAFDWDCDWDAITAND